MKVKKHKILFTLFSPIIACGLYAQTEVEKDLDETNKNKYTKVLSDSTNKLIDKIEELEIEYTVWGCACPNWIQTKNKSDEDLEKNTLRLHFYIEPAEDSLKLPSDFDPFKHKLIVIGQFYEREDYPQGTIEMEEPMPKAKVFRYTSFEMVEVEKE